MPILLPKFISLFLYPLGLIWLLLLLALWLRKKPRWQKAAIILALAVIWIGGNTWVSTSLVRSLEWQYLPPEPLPQAEVIVVLGGSTQPALYPRSTVEIGTAGDRLIYAAHLYHQGAAPNILVSGGYIAMLSERSTSTSQDMAELLVMLGVPEAAIWQESESRNTYENAVNSRAYLDKRGIDRIVLVTSALHMPRAVGLFEYQSFDVIPAPTDYAVTQAGWEQLWQPNLVTQLFNLLPDVSNLGNSTKAIKEYLAICLYNLQGLTR
ncbi:MAG: YdcF family protein [Chloroflexota bacterium]|nr:YdcF family protein [Chloroflexota bacterium]